jgi:hypothetical protein
MPDIRPVTKSMPLWYGAIHGVFPPTVHCFSFSRQHTYTPSFPFFSLCTCIVSRRLRGMGLFLLLVSAVIAGQAVNTQLFEE